MRLVIQRVSRASVEIGGRLHSETGRGLMVLVGVREGDTEADAEWLAAKTAAMRIFPDAEGVMNRSLLDIGGEVLAVSQFTLNASTKKGNRPSYIHAAGHDLAVPLYNLYCSRLSAILAEGCPGGTPCPENPVRTGVFGADMQVSLVNDGPVTIVIDSRLRE